MLDWNPREINNFELDYLLRTGDYKGLREEFNKPLTFKKPYPKCPVCKWAEEYVSDYFTHTTGHHRISLKKALEGLREQFDSYQINGSYDSLYVPRAVPDNRMERLEKLETRVRDFRYHIYHETVLEMTKELREIADEIKCIRNND